MYALIFIDFPFVDSVGCGPRPQTAYRMLWQMLHMVQMFQMPRLVEMCQTLHMVGMFQMLHMVEMNQLHHLV